MNINRLAKPLYLLLGWVCVLLGLAGIIMPILPTTPFLLVAVWAFSRGSPVLAEKIRNHPQAGPYIRDWEDHGVIPLKAKLLATAMMAAMAAALFFWATLPLWFPVVMTSVMVLVGVYIWTRPSRAA
ncbi:MAG: YbaN family protein [Rhizobiales bacterium]|nr:YbaN family protein [Hyphomicrobiales bacterium]